MLEAFARSAEVLARHPLPVGGFPLPRLPEEPDREQIDWQPDRAREKHRDQRIICHREEPEAQGPVGLALSIAAIGNPSSAAENDQPQERLEAVGHGREPIYPNWSGGRWSAATHPPR